MKKKKAILVLEDGTSYEGYSFGAEGETFGEVVFNTSMTGYQEILTDPSYAGQIVNMTYPHIGNYGINSNDFESCRPFVEGFIVREASAVYSNWRAEKSLQQFLEENQIVGIEGIDTRALTKHIRLEGAMKGAISTIDLNTSSLADRVRDFPSIVGQDLVGRVTIDRPYWWEDIKDGRYKVVAYDCGMKLNILRELEQAGCAVYVVPASFSADDVLKLKPDGIFLSNGPGDPAGVPYVFETIRQLLGKKPVFGICLGHQMLGLALGGKTYKLKFGHRGANQPVKNLKTGQVEITSQNHGFAVDAESIPVDGAFGQIEVSHINLDDQTVEGLYCRDILAFSVQYHPEASPGPHDSKYLFKEFTKLMGKSS